jgi:hypothetical protein
MPICNPRYPGGHHVWTLHPQRIGQKAAKRSVGMPVLRRGVPRNRRGKLWTVKIGVIDEVLAASQPYPAEDFDTVIRQLQEFLVNEGAEAAKDG